MTRFSQFVRSVPGIKAAHAIITPVCRANRSAAGAFDEAISRLRNEYEECIKLPCNRDVNYHVVLTVERGDSGQ